MADAPPVRTKSRSPLVRKVFLAVAGLLSFLLAGGSAFSIAAIKNADRELHKHALLIGGDAGCNRASECLRDVSAPPGTCTKKVCTFLILGSDTRFGLSSKQQSQFGNSATVQGQRADTIIVVTIDPIHDRTVVLSIPRDLRVEIPGYGMDKINSAFEHKNGSDLMVRMVEKLTGLQVNHFVEVNFAGFQRLVTALGGVKICIDKPMIDPLAGLHLPRAGCYHLEGPQALAFVRARHVQGDVIPDFSRISRQQQFMRVVIQKLLSFGVFTHYTQLVKAVSDNLIVDKGLNVYDLQGLTRKLSGLGQQGVMFRILPAVPVTVGGVDYVEEAPEARILLREIKRGQPLSNIGLEAPATDISPANITVRVYDAASGGRAQKVASLLTDAGFVVLPVEAAPPSFTKTELLYRRSTAREMAVVSSYVKVYASVETFRYAKDSGGDVAVVVGPDYRGIL